MIQIDRTLNDKYVLYEGTALLYAFDTIGELFAYLRESYEPKPTLKTAPTKQKICDTCNKGGGRDITFIYGDRGGLTTRWSRWVCPHCLDHHKTALEKIACFDDGGANQRLRENGSYGSFDEPNSVQIARKALAGQQ